MAKRGIPARYTPIIPYQSWYKYGYESKIPEYVEIDGMAKWKVRKGNCRCTVWACDIASAKLEANRLRGWPTGEITEVTRQVK